MAYMTGVAEEDSFMSEIPLVGKALLALVLAYVIGSTLYYFVKRMCAGQALPSCSGRPVGSGVPSRGLGVGGGVAESVGVWVRRVCTVLPGLKGEGDMQMWCGRFLRAPLPRVGL